MLRKMCALLIAAGFLVTVGIGCSGDGGAKVVTPSKTVTKSAADSPKGGEKNPNKPAAQ